MTTYLWLDLAMIALAAGIAYLLVGNLRYVSSSLWILAPLLVLTTIFDNVLTSLPIVTYVSSHILGFHIGTVPIEDYAYPFAAVILIPALDQRFSRGK